MAGPGGHGDGRPGGDVADVEIVLRAEDLGGHQRVGDGLVAAGMVTWPGPKAAKSGESVWKVDGPSIWVEADLDPPSRLRSPGPGDGDRLTPFARSCPDVELGT